MNIQNNKSIVKTLIVMVIMKILPTKGIVMMIKMIMVRVLLIMRRIVTKTTVVVMITKLSSTATVITNVVATTMRGNYESTMTMIVMMPVSLVITMSLKQR